MAKSQLYGNPFMDYIYRVGGVFPVRRGHHDEEAFITAFAILDRGGCVGMYCEGGRSRIGPPRRAASPASGASRCESGVPVVPVAIHGSQGVRSWKRLQFPKVTIQFGEPHQLPAERVAHVRRGPRGLEPGLRPGEGDVRGARVRGP